MMNYAFKMCELPCKLVYYFQLYNLSELYAEYGGDVQWEDVNSDHLLKSLSSMDHSTDPTDAVQLYDSGYPTTGTSDNSDTTTSGNSDVDSKSRPYKFKGHNFGKCNLATCGNCNTTKSLICNEQTCGSCNVAKCVDYCLDESSESFSLKNGCRNLKRRSNRINILPAHLHSTGGIQGESTDSEPLLFSNDENIFSNLSEEELGSPLVNVVVKVKRKSNPPKTTTSPVKLTAHSHSTNSNSDIVLSKTESLSHSSIKTDDTVQNASIDANPDMIDLSVSESTSNSVTKATNTETRSESTLVRIEDTSSDVETTSNNSKTLDDKSKNGLRNFRVADLESVEKSSRSLRSSKTDSLTCDVSNSIGSVKDSSTTPTSTCKRRSYNLQTGSGSMISSDIHEYDVMRLRKVSVSLRPLDESTAKDCYVTSDPELNKIPASNNCAASAILSASTGRRRRSAALACNERMKEQMIPTKLFVPVPAKDSTKSDSSSREMNSKVSSSVNTVDECSAESDSTFKADTKKSCETELEDVVLIESSSCQQNVCENPVTGIEIIHENVASKTTAGLKRRSTDDELPIIAKKTKLNDDDDDEGVEENSVCSSLVRNRSLAEFMVDDSDDDVIPLTVPTVSIELHTLPSSSLH